MGIFLQMVWKTNRQGTFGECEHIISRNLYIKKRKNRMVEIKM
jgi:hypothetical protein